jgi:hypothetical protein
MGWGKSVDLLVFSFIIGIIAIVFKVFPILPRFKVVDDIEAVVLAVL